MYIVIPIVDKDLGHSVIYETYQGDLNQAQKVAEQALAKAKKGTDSALITDAWLACGVVNLLQGELAAAQNCFEEIHQTPSNDSGLLMRAASYANLAVYNQYNRFPDGNGAGAQEIGVRWSSQGYAQAEMQVWQGLTSQVTDATLRLEGNFVHGVLCNLQVSRSILQTSRYTPSGLPADQLLSIQLPALTDFIEDTVAFGADPRLGAYLKLSLADLCRRGSDMQLAQQFLGQALADYQQSKDAAGQALCYMMWGDWLAAPFSSPLSWNLAIHESSSEGSNLDWALEAVEFDLTSADTTNARMAYDEAFRLFHLASAPRGQAVIELRCGYLAMLAEDTAAL